jgi:hypothetical protein
MKRLPISILVAICLIASMTAFAGDKPANAKLVGAQWVFAPASHRQFTSQSGITYSEISRLIILNTSFTCSIELTQVMLEGYTEAGPPGRIIYQLVGPVDSFRPPIIIAPRQSLAYRSSRSEWGIPFFPYNIDLDGDGLTEEVRPLWIVLWHVLSPCTKTSPPLIESARHWSGVFTDGGPVWHVSVDYTQGTVIEEW